jgi:hypothetical protein
MVATMTPIFICSSVRLNVGTGVDGGVGMVLIAATATGLRGTSEALPPRIFTSYTRDKLRRQSRLKFELVTAT